MKLLCQIMTVLPLELIVSLPNQLLGHVPITQISSQLTARLEAADVDESETSDAGNGEDEESQDKKGLPELSDLFEPGQFLRAVVVATKAAGTTGSLASRHVRDEVQKNSRRVELSLVPTHVNSGLAKADLHAGMVSLFIGSCL